MKKFYKYYSVFLLLLTACNSNNSTTISESEAVGPTLDNDEDVSIDDPSLLTCSQGLSLILEDDEGFENVSTSDAIVFQRGGAYNNQLTIDFTNNQLVFGDPRVNYWGDPYLDEYFHWINPYRDFSADYEAHRQERINAGSYLSYILSVDKDELIFSYPIDNVYDVHVASEWKIGPDLLAFYRELNHKLETIGCPLSGFTPNVLSSYKSEHVSSEDYWVVNTELISDPDVVFKTLGGEITDLMIYDMPNYQELSNWKDYVNINPFKKMSDGSTKNVGYMLIIYDNSWMDVTQMVANDPETQAVHDADTFYKHQLATFNGSAYQLFLQNFFRDIYFGYANEGAPKVYFINADLPSNSDMARSDKGGGSNAVTIEEWADGTHGEADNAFLFTPNGDGVNYKGYTWRMDYEIERNAFIEWMNYFYLDQSRVTLDLLYDYYDDIYATSDQRFYGSYNINRLKYFGY